MLNVTIRTERPPDEPMSRLVCQPRNVTPARQQEIVFTNQVGEEVLLAFRADNPEIDIAAVLDNPGPFRLRQDESVTVTVRVDDPEVPDGNFRFGVVRLATVVEDLWGGGGQPTGS